MKRLHFIPFAFAGVAAFIISFYACSSDETDNQALPKSQLLLKRSHELAEKYNVHITLDKTKLDETAQTLTIEQMENDYKDWANIQQVQFILHNSACGRTSNNIKLTKRRTSFEYTSINGHYEDFADNNKDFYVTIDYNLGNNGSGLVRVELNCKGSCGATSLVPIGFTFYNSNKYSFTATGSVYLSGGTYKGSVCVWFDHKTNGELYCSIR